uniref:Protein kinase domain-containing protein n=1 Tax=Mycena chlorophos TaxID=658473 RepID=A0ABQ0M9A0_MYCCL|nr:predicted protein [Mycena chlorophos]
MCYRRRYLAEITACQIFDPLNVIHSGKEITTARNFLKPPPTSTMSASSSGTFAAGDTIQLRLEDGLERRYTIIKLFLPFTRSVVLLARPDQQTGPVVLKLYDPRYLNERHVLSQYRPSFPWDAKLEREAAETRRREECPGAGDLQRLLWAEEDVAWNSERALLWEEWFYRECMNSFANESSAYDQMTSMQGGAIPKLLGRGVVVDSERDIEVPALVLEYVEGISMQDAPHSVVRAATDAWAHLSQAVIRFNKLDIAHEDINQTNILLSPDGGRAVIIDFGRARRGQPTMRGVDYDARRLEELFRKKGLCISSSG